MNGRAGRAVAILPANGARATGRQPAPSVSFASLDAAPGRDYDPEAMITSDPARRAAVLAEVMELLQRQAAADDRELLLAFAPVVYMETPDRVAFGLSC